jgi:uncharacterized protein
MGEHGVVQTFVEVTTHIVSILRKHPAVASAEVFGSFARGEQTPDSDIDIILVKKDNSVLGLEFFAIADEIEEATGRKVDLITPAVANGLAYGEKIRNEAKHIYES